MFNEQQEKLLKRVEELFLRLGIKSLTMDDVARELGISKKTLYQFVDNKDDLVLKVMERHINEDCVHSEALRKESTDAIDEIFKVTAYNAVDLGRMKANIVYELQRYHPEAWAKMQTYNWKQLYSVVHENLVWGIQDGLYRTDFDANVIARLHIASVLGIFDENIFPRPDFDSRIIFKEYMMHYLYGILSEKGRIVLKSKLEQHKSI
jgi:AcrR family transcriptional regulator